MKRIFILVLALSAGLTMYPQKRSKSIIVIPGTIFTYTIEGTGPIVIAFTGSENLGRAMYSDNLRDHLTFIQADPQLIPQSVLDTLTMNSILEDIELVRDFLGLEKISVMGHSMFGVIPLEYALKYPDHAAGSISSGALPFTTTRAFDMSGVYWDSSATPERKAILKENLERLKNDKVEKSASERFWDQYKANVPLRFADPHFDISLMEKAGARSTNIAFINRFWGVVLKDYDNSAQYQQILTPVLVISGKYDFGAPYLLWKDFGKTMPDYTFHLFENAGHNPMLEIPEEFDQLLIDWITAHK